MKKQYLAQIKRREPLCNNIEWENAVKHITGKQYASTLEEAKECIQKCIAEYAPMQSGKTTIIPCGQLSASVTLDETTRQALEVIDSRIKMREVTEWDIIE